MRENTNRLAEKYFDPIVRDQKEVHIMSQQAQQKKKISFNPFVMLFCVIAVVFAASFFVSPGAFDRQMVDGRNQVVPGSFHATEKAELSAFDIFRAVPNGLIGSASIVFLVLIVGGAIEIFNGMTRLNGTLTI